MNQQTSDQSSLVGKKVIVLGGSSGIGLATAKAAAVEGALVTIVSSNQQRIDRALQELPSGSRGHAADFTDEAQVAALFAQTGNLDHLVFTAGENIQLGPIADTTTDAAQQYFRLRFWGAYTAVRYAAKWINAGGSITLTGGIASQRPGPGWSLGASICAAMEGFTRAMAVELAPLRVNLVSPGVVKTNLWAGLSEAERSSMYQTMEEKLPVRQVGNPNDIARTYLYLMQQPYSTGQIITVDGGAVLV